MCVKKIDTGKKHLQFTAADSSHLTFGKRPRELVFFQALVPEAESVSLPIEQFENPPGPSAKEKKVAGKGIQFELPLNKGGEAIDLFSHVSVTGADMDIDLIPVYRHRASINLERAAADESFRKTIRIPPGMTISYCAGSQARSTLTNLFSAGSCKRRFQ